MQQQQPMMMQQPGQPMMMQQQGQPMMMQQQGQPMMMAGGAPVQYANCINLADDLRAHWDRASRGIGSTAAYFVPNTQLCVICHQPIEAHKPKAVHQQEVAARSQQQAQINAQREKERSMCSGMNCTIA